MMTWDTNDKHEARMAAKRNRASDENDERPKRVKLASGSDTETQRSDDSNKFLIICFDLELTDGSYASEIFQIGARAGEKDFSCYILPRGVIDWGVTRYVNGIKVTDKSEEGRRLVDKDRQLIESLGPKEGLESFLTWIEEEKKAGGFSSAILVSHGTTDMPALLNNLARDDLVERFNASVTHFVDSLTYFQKFHCEFGKHGMASLSERLLPGEKFKAHDAGEDARMLHLCLRAVADPLLLPNLLTKAVTVDQAWTKAAAMLEKTLKKNEKRKNKTKANLFNAIK